MQFDGTGQLEKRYLYGPAVDEVLAEETLHEDPGTGQLVSDGVRWPLPDHLGTVRDLAVFDDGGTPTDPSDDETVVSPEHHFQYDGFGNAVGGTSPGAADFLFGFTGRPFDADTSLQWNLNRWYDPAVGRWLTEDPIGFSAGDANLYRYCTNSPLVFTDPIGLQGHGSQSYWEEDGPIEHWWDYLDTRKNGMNDACRWLKRKIGQLLYWDTCPYSEWERERLLRERRV